MGKILENEQIIDRVDTLFLRENPLGARRYKRTMSGSW